MKLKDLKDKIENIKVSWDYEDTYNKLHNACIDYQNDTQDFSVDLDSPFDEIFTCDVVEEIAKQELEQGGLSRLYYFMGNVNFATQNLIRINAYGNCEEIKHDDLQLLKETILDNINYALKKEDELCL